MEKKIKFEIKAGDSLEDTLRQLKEGVELAKKLQASGGTLTGSEATDEQLKKMLQATLLDIDKGIPELEKEKALPKKDAELLRELSKTASSLITGLDRLKGIVKEYVYPASRVYIGDSINFTSKEPLKPKHYKGAITKAGKQLQKWETPEGTYTQELIETLPGFNTPVVTGDFVRHMGSLFILLWKYNKKRERQGEKEPVTEIEFTLQQYQRQRGRTDEEIQAGGSFTQKAKHLLVTGATTSFIRAEKDNPGGFEIGHFYALRTPGQKRGTYELLLSPIYAKDFLQAYTTKQGGYLPLYERVINDKETEGKKTYLMFFVFAVLQQLNSTGEAQPGDFIALQTLLDKARAGEYILKRDKEAWRCFMEGIQYYNKMTSGLKEIVLQGETEDRKGITDFTKLDTWTYETFKEEILQPLGLRYCRDLKLAFMGNLPAIKGTAQDTEPDVLPAEIL